MPRKADYIGKYIKSSLLPVVSEDGFKLYRPKILLRVRGPFIEQVSIDLTRHGTKSFYVHYFSNLLAHPMLNINSYSVGNRLQKHPDDGHKVSWRGATDEGASKAIDSVVDAYLRHIRPWFESVGSIPGYVFEELAKGRGRSMETLGFATAFLEGGHTGRAWWICNDLLEGVSELDAGVREACQEYVDTHQADEINEVMTNDKYIDHREHYSSIPVPDTPFSSIESLRIGWRKRNIERFGLEDFVV